MFLNTNKKKSFQTIFYQYYLYFLSALFILSSIDKIAFIDKFNQNLLETGLIYVLFVPVITYLIPSLELILSCLLHFEVTKKIALLIYTLLMSLFTVYLILMVVYLEHFPCSCGGLFQYMNINTHIVLNLTIVSINIFFLLKMESNRVLVKNY
jgi:hypothetical protein